MRIKIETYRGQEIEYDDDRDKFICQMVIEDSYREKTSLKLTEVRKEIDRFIKQNADFKPFYFLDYDYRRVEIVAVRTDGKFVDSKRNHWSIDAIKCGYQYGGSGTKSYVLDHEIKEEEDALELEFEGYRQNYLERKRVIRSKYKPLDVTSLDAFVPSTESVTLQND